MSNLTDTVSMRRLFVCDVHIPPRLATVLRAQGFEAVHVYNINLETADDMAIWRYAKANGAIIVTKDKDFVRISASQPGPPVIHVCTGNSRNSRLVEKLLRSLPEILTQLDSGRGVIELR